MGNFKLTLPCRAREIHAWALTMGHCKLTLPSCGRQMHVWALTTRPLQAHFNPLGPTNSRLDTTGQRYAHFATQGPTNQCPGSIQTTQRPRTAHAVSWTNPRLHPYYWVPASSLYSVGDDLSTSAPLLQGHSKLTFTSLGATNSRLDPYSWQTFFANFTTQGPTNQRPSTIQTAHRPRKAHLTSKLGKSSLDPYYQATASSVYSIGAGKSTPAPLLQGHCKLTFPHWGQQIHVWTLSTFCQAGADKSAPEHRPCSKLRLVASQQDTYDSAAFWQDHKRPET